MLKFSPVVSVQQISFVSGLRSFIISLLLALATATGSASAQNALNGATPSGLTPGAPAGSYSLSGFETVNPYNGGLNFHLPLVSIAGRGSAAASVGLPIEQKWSVDKNVYYDELGQENATYNPNYNKWVFSPFYVGATVAGRRGGSATQMCHRAGGTPETNPRYYIKTLTRLTVTMADGTEYELRDKESGGEPKTVPRNSNLCPTGSFNRKNIFVTADGTAATFVSDADIYDDYDPATDVELRPSGYLMMRDGSKYRFDNGYLSWIRDRNGNKLTFSYATGLTTVTDSLNCQVTIERDVYDTYGLCDRITYKGFGGAARTVYVTKTNLGNALRSDHSLQTFSQLFPTLSGSGYTYFNPTVASGVILPNGKSYQFSYNSYGELARVVLPTGGAIEYDWQVGDAATASAGGVVENQTIIPYDYGVYRRVAERRVYADGSTLEHKMIYPRAEETSGNTESNVAVETRAASGALLGKTRHYYYGSARQSFLQQATDYSKWREGREKKTESFDFNGTTVLRTTDQSWEQRASISWWTGATDDSPPLDPRLVETVSTNEIGQVTKTSAINPIDSTRGFDQYNNQTDVYEYNYGQGAAGTLARRTHTDYLTTNANGDYASTTPTASSVHIRNLPTQTWVSADAAGADKKSLSTFGYDYYANDGSHAALLNRAGISGHDAAFTSSYSTRGNVTSAVKWFIVNGDYVATYQQYDVAGNVVKVKDGRGYETSAEYDDRFGSPDGEARANSAPSELSSQGQTSYAFVTKVTNALGHSTYSQFDFSTGRAVDGEDANGIVASGYSTGDALDRPTRIIRGVGTAAQNQTTFAYDDTNRIVTATSDFASYNDNLLKSESLYDSLGRTYETRSYETGSTYIKQTQTFDALGRAKRAYNPHRTASDSTYGWSESTYDALGRVTQVATSDNATVNSSYSGNAVTVTDQAGKVRRSLTDALGRLQRVDEPDASGNLDALGNPAQDTNYQYDVMDNLTQVQQGVQTRAFTYDALGRLTSAANPESGTVSYGYDNNGNLVSKYDARAITATIVYDALNRPVSKTYNDLPQTTAPVYYYYDNQVLPSGAPAFSRGYSTGRLVAVTYGASSSNGTYRSYDALGRVAQQLQQTDGVNYQVDAAYNLASAMTSQTYPGTGGNRRTVSYGFDAAGRLSSLTSSATAYSAAASVSNVSYAAHGALSSQTLGNGLLHQMGYNSRLQPTSITLASHLSLTYSYGATATVNNGNITSINYSGGGLSYTQSFTYDSLNRLATAQENGGAAWTQTNGYDRYGNRTVTAGIGQSLSFNTNNNRISGLTYDSAGNVTNDNAHSYAFDAENKIVQLDNVLAYRYDGEGKRVRKFVTENTRFVYGIGGELLAEYNASTGLIQKEYVYGASGLTATIEPTTGTQYLTQDHLGSPRVVTNASGSVVARRDFMPFGEEIASNVGGRSSLQGWGASNSIRQQFTSYERDIESGLDYAKARHFGSSYGRFTSPDPFGPWAMTEKEKAEFYSEPQKWNLYVYVTNNPLRYSDPTGFEKYDPNSVSAQDEAKIRKAFEAILKYGTSHQKRIVRAIQKSDLLIKISSTVGGSGASGVINPSATQQKIDSQRLNIIQGLGETSIILNPATVANSVSLEGTLVHEGRHSYQKALSISDFSFADRLDRKPSDLDGFQTEYSAHKAYGDYVMQAVKLNHPDKQAFVNESLGLGVTEKSGNGIKISEKGIRDRLLNAYGVNDTTKRGDTFSKAWNLTPRNSW